jgi:hypothetical protein
MLCALLSHISFLFTDSDRRRWNVSLIFHLRFSGKAEAAGVSHRNGNGSGSNSKGTVTEEDRTEK